MSIQAELAQSRELVGHRLMLLPVESHVRFAGIQPFHVAGKRYDLDTIQAPVGRIIADDYSRAPLLNLAADARAEPDPPDLTAAHRPRPRSSLRPTPALRL